jgi:type IV secretory pathway VirB2 component (pilin)
MNPRVAEIVLVAILLVFLSSTPSFATNVIGSALCTVGGFFKGNAGKGLAVISVTIVGIGLLYGKMKWETAVTVGVGVAVLFGADALVVALSGVKCT